MLPLATLAVILTATATGDVPAAPAGIDWIGYLQNPLIGGVIVAVLVQVLKAIPQIPIDKGGKVAAAAAILSVFVGFLSAWSSGSISGFDMNAAWAILVEAIKTLTASMGAFEATKQAGLGIGLSGPPKDA